MRMIGGMFAACLVLTSTGKVAPAAMVYTFQDAKLSGGAASLTGTFTTDDARTTVTSYDFATTANGGFTGHHYTTSDSVVNLQNLSTSFSFEVTTTIPGYHIDIAFATALTSSGATIKTSGGSSETQNNYGNRAITSGIVTSAVPEPSSLALFGIAGVIGLAVARGRRGWSA